jgi:regulator of protease activity HflC (stomatin/prohibitin superfamily)
VNDTHTHTENYSISEALKAVDKELSRPSVNDLIQAIQGDEAEQLQAEAAQAANRELEREAAATSAVAVAMAQQDRIHPTLLSEWTRKEVARLLHQLYADPGAEIKLGGQTMGSGFTKLNGKNAEDERDLAHG